MKTIKAYLKKGLEKIKPYLAINLDYHLPFDLKWHFKSKIFKKVLFTIITLMLTTIILNSSFNYADKMAKQEVQLENKTSLFDEYYLEIKEIYNKYQSVNQDFLNDFNNFKTRTQAKAFIINSSKEIISNFKNYDRENIVVELNINDKTYKFSLAKTGVYEINALEKWLKNDLEDLVISLNEEVLNNNTQTYDFKEIRYLALGDDIFINKDHTLKKYSCQVVKYQSEYLEIINNTVDSYSIINEDESLVMEQLASKEIDFHYSEVVGTDIYEFEYLDDLYMAYLTPIAPNRVLVLYESVEYSSSAYQAAIYSTKPSFYFMLALFVLGTSLFISYLFTRNIKVLNQATKDITNGNYDVKINNYSNDELGQLAHNIDDMALQLKKTIEQLKTEIAYVKELEALRKDFLNQFTHEIKTPLNIINGYSELLEETNDEKQKQKYLISINEETQKINDLVLEMLKLSSLESSKVEVKKELVDLEILVSEIIEEKELLIKQKNLKIVLEVKKPNIIGDQKMLTTAIDNLFANALKHTPVNGNIIITIDQGVMIYNEGTLIEEKILSVAFEPFITNDYQGSGLGLAICQSIFKLHNFDYGIENKAQGVNVYFKVKEGDMNHE